MDIRKSEVGITFDLALRVHAEVHETNPLKGRLCICDTDDETIASIAFEIEDSDGWNALAEGSPPRHHLVMQALGEAVLDKAMNTLAWVAKITAAEEKEREQG